jgi:hypothetical protein
MNKNGGIADMRAIITPIVCFVVPAVLKTVNVVFGKHLKAITRFVLLTTFIVVIIIIVIVGIIIIAVVFDTELFHHSVTSINDSFTVNHNCGLAPVRITAASVKLFFILA